MKKNTTQTTKQKISAAMAPGMHVIGGELNAMATHHIGYVDCDGSQTPVGINMNGVTFEDANYALADNDHPRFLKWERQVLEALRRGEPRGKAAGLDWTFVGEADSDTSVLYPTVKPKAASHEATCCGRYELLVAKAEEFVGYRSGGMTMVDPAVNLAVLQAMLLGWLYCQDWFNVWRGEHEVAYPRDNPYLIADDWCLEAASDATRKNPAYP